MLHNNTITRLVQHNNRYNLHIVLVVDWKVCNEGKKALLLGKVVEGTVLRRRKLSSIGWESGGRVGKTYCIMRL